ncbi:MAG TPA: hypothetical protein VKU87_05460 [Thermomicrobiaceae bacterium]|nr:hypothetical protein [Thermomicrobiaceae bacterium]
MRSDARVDGERSSGAPRPVSRRRSQGQDRRALAEDEQAAYDDLNRFLAGLVRRKCEAGRLGLEESTTARVAAAGTSTGAGRRRARSWSIKVLGVSHLRDVVELCRALGEVPGVRAVRVAGLSADHIHLALATAATIDKPAIETILDALPASVSDETSFVVEESRRSGSRVAARR